MHILTMPPGARAKAHLHESHETAIYVLSGEVDYLVRRRLEQQIVVKAGDLFYIPAGVPHLPANLSDSRPRRSSPAPTPTSRKASSCCRNWTRWCRLIDRLPTWRAQHAYGTA